MIHINISNNRKPGFNKTWICLAIILLALVAMVAAGYLHINRASSAQKNDQVVPINIQRAVNFPIYYPDQSKLPDGYFLDITSFKNPVENGALYKITYGNDQKIVFSLQAKPSDDDLKAFTSNYIPLNNEVNTPIGKAKIGLYANQKQQQDQTMVSLPTNDKTWFIITAPSDINQNKLKQVLNSLKK